MALDNLNASIPLQAGQPSGPFGPDLKQLITMQALAQKLQLGQQEVQGQNVLRQLYGNRDNIDMATGYLKPNVIPQLVRASPSVGLSYLQDMAQARQRRAVGQLAEAKLTQEHLKSDYQMALRARETYNSYLKGGMPDSAARARTLDDVYGPYRQEVMDGGQRGPEVMSQFPLNFDPVRNERFIAAYEAGLTKPMSLAQKGAEARGEEHLSIERERLAFEKDKAGAREYSTPENVLARRPDGSSYQTMGVYDKKSGGWFDANDRSRSLDVQQKVGARQAASPEAIDATAELIATYKQAPLSGYAMRSGDGPEIMKRIKEINPDYNAQNYQVAQRVRNSFASGAQDAKQMDAMNTVVHHLGVFDEVSKALQNHDVNAINRVINYVRTELGHPEVTSFDAAKGLIADEVVQAVTGSGAVFDREGMQKLLSSDRSGEQFQKQAEILRRLMAGRMGAKYQRWSSVHLPDDEFVAKLEPETIEGIRSYVPSNLKKALGEGGKEPTANQDAATTSPQPLQDIEIPPQGLDHLNKAGENIPVDFGPGLGVWRLKNGKPVRDPGT